MKKELLKNKRIFILLIIVPLIFLIFLTPEFKYVYNVKKTDLLGVKNKFFKEYLLNNENQLQNSCVGRGGSIAYYNSLYNQVINVVFNMNKQKYITDGDRNKIFKLLKKSNIDGLFNRVKNLNLMVMNTDSLAEYNYLKALANELKFYQSKDIELYYKKAIETNQFESKYYFQLAKFYQKNCNYDEAINILLKTSSIANANNNLCGIYAMLGDLYFDKRDYENSLVYYVNSLVNLDYRNKDKSKVGVLTRIGDIMSVRGEYFEAINYYKYALSINDKKMSKNSSATLFLKLAGSYYSYGNYENSLKFAKSAMKIAQKTNDELLYSKAQYYICLSYEYLGVSHDETKKVCENAIRVAEEYKDKIGDLNSHLSIASMLDFSAYTRDAERAVAHLKQALSINYKKNVYNKIYILENIAQVKSYNGGKNNKADALKLYEELDEYYDKYNVGIGCCNNILKGFVKQQLNMEAPEIDYLNGEKNLKNRKANLSTLYSYLSDYYREKKQYKLALYYAKKSLELNKQIYKFDHHYIKYASDRVDVMENLMKK